MLRSLLLNPFRGIQRHEWPKVSMLSSIFFLVIGTYWIVKPIKRSVLINFFAEQPLQLFGMALTGAQAEQLGKVLNVFAVYAVVILFTWLAQRCSRRHLILIFATLFSGLFALFALLLQNVTAPVVWAFYVMGDMYNTVMIALFWAFTNDLVTSDEAKRTYGLIGLGGVVGGFIGATIVRSAVEDLGRTPLLLACIAPLALVAVLGYLANRTSSKVEDADAPAAPASASASASAFEGARLVLSAKYLMALAGLIVCYEIASNVIDFQLSTTVERRIEAPLEKDAFFGLVGQIIGVGSILVQLFLTSYVMKRFSIRVALTFLPLAVLISTTGYLILPTLAFAAAMSASDNALNFSINQSAKEALYVPTSPEVTYKAKAFIDMFLQRLAKVVSVVINLGFVLLITEQVRWLSVVTFGVLAVWLTLVMLIGRGYRVREAWEARHVTRAAPGDGDAPTSS